MPRDAKNEMESQRIYIKNVFKQQQKRDEKELVIFFCFVTQNL